MGPADGGSVGRGMLAKTSRRAVVTDKASQRDQGEEIRDREEKVAGNTETGDLRLDLSGLRPGEEQRCTEDSDRKSVV